MSDINKKQHLKSGYILKNQTRDLIQNPLDFHKTGRAIKSKIFSWSGEESYIPKFRLDLYRFLRDSVPLLNACIWTWSRMASAPGKFTLETQNETKRPDDILKCLDQLTRKIYPFRFQRTAGLESFLPLMFSSLFTDGAIAGFVRLERDYSGVSGFVPIEPGYLFSRSDKNGNRLLFLQNGDKAVQIKGDDFYYFGLDADLNSGLGESILKSIPFVAYIEQQLIDDMRRAAHNAGYHRLHVQITPPEKLSGEADSAYVERINEYFDESVSMIRGCGPDDNPVTWDNVKIDYIGPRNVQGIGNSWFMNHRAMVEEICAGTNLSPFMLGYSYGTTHNWAQFKYDLVMRQVQSVQRQMARFLEWLGNIELALRGFNCRCRYRFDNSYSYNASDLADIKSGEIDNLLKLYQAGLISKDDAAVKAGDLL